MNFLYIHTHDCGCFFDPYGYNAGTPHLMSFARRASTFVNAYSAAPTCSPSRVGLLTGCAPHTTGMYGLAHHGPVGEFNMYDYSKHMVGLLNNAGVETVLCGIQHEACDMESIGYIKHLNCIEHVELFNMSDYRDKIVEWDLNNARLVADYIKTRNTDVPLFLSFGMYSTHRTYPNIRPDVDPRFIQIPQLIPNIPEAREDMACFISGVRTVDDCFGIVMNALKESDMADDTIVLFTTDHGISLPNCKCNLTDSGIKVAMILDYPGNKKKGSIVQSLVSQIDVLPTIFDLMGIGVPEWVQGKSLIPILEGKQQEVNDYVFSEVSYHCEYEPMRAVRARRYKYIKYFDESKRCINNVDGSKLKTIFIENGFENTCQEREQLYDMLLDPAERNNLARNSKFETIKLHLENVLLEWMEQTGDDLLKGKPYCPWDR